MSVKMSQKYKIDNFLRELLEKTWLFCAFQTPVKNGPIRPHTFFALRTSGCDFNVFTFIQTMIFHLDRVREMFWDFGSNSERVATEEERELVTQLLTSEIEKDDGKLVYDHKVTKIQK